MSNTGSINFRDYMVDIKKLLSLLFDHRLIKKLNNTPLKELDWQGLDVHDTNITTVFPNIRDRFTKEWIDYFKDRDVATIDLFLYSVFHYGYQQGVDVEKEKKKNNSLNLF
jgi:hypothetical protein